MARKITPKQKKFADKYLETGNGTLAIRESYAPTDYATERSMASENLTKPNIREYIENHADRAVSVVLELMESAENETVRLNSAKDVLDRAGYSPVEKSLSVTANMNAEDLRKVITDGINQFRRPN